MAGRRSLRCRCLPVCTCFAISTPVLALFTALAAVGAVFDPLARMPNASLLARGEVRKYAVLGATTSVVVAAVASAATAVAGLWGQFVAAAVMPALLLVAFLPAWQRALPGSARGGTRALVALD